MVTRTPSPPCLICMLPCKLSEQKPLTLQTMRKAMPTISETCTAADAEMTQMAVFFFRPNLSPQDVSVYYYMKNGNASVQL